MSGEEKKREGNAKHWKPATADAELIWREGGRRKKGKKREILVPSATSAGRSAPPNTGKNGGENCFKGERRGELQSCCVIFRRIPYKEEGEKGKEEHHCEESFSCLFHCREKRDPGGKKGEGSKIQFLFFCGKGEGNFSGACGAPIRRGAIMR